MSSNRNRMILLSFGLVGIASIALFIVLGDLGMVDTELLLGLTLSNILNLGIIVIIFAGIVYSLIVKRREDELT